MSGTDIQYGDISLRTPYAMSGTDIAHAARRANGARDRGRGGGEGSIPYPPTPCPVPMQARLLCGSYAMSGTHLGDAQNILLLFSTQA
eukprot:3455681-Rhodomonas_salina.2